MEHDHSTHIPVAPDRLYNALTTEHATDIEEYVNRTFEPIRQLL